MRSLEAALPLFVGHVSSDRPSPWFKRVLVLEVAVLLLGIVASMLGEHHIDARPDLILVGMGLGAWVLFVPLAWLVAHGSSRGAKQFLVLAIAGLVAFPVGLLGMGTASNTLLDSSPPQELRTAVVGEPRCTDKNNSAKVRDWRDPRDVLVLVVGRRFCRAVQPGDTLVLVVHAGFWGWEWISDMRIDRTRAGAKTKPRQ